MENKSISKELYLLRKKLVYRSKYRGCKEMDIILGNYTDLLSKNTSVDYLLQYKKILDIDDHQLYYYFCNLENIPSDLSILKDIISCHLSR